jgi:hypothetical protein
MASNLILMGGVIAFVAIVDPYQFYHPVLGGHPKFDSRIQRFLVPGLARTSHYEVALAGTSMLQNIPNSAVHRICGRPAANLCIAAASIHEEALTIALALNHKETRAVIATLDYHSLSGGTLGQVLNGGNSAFPPYLYDSSIVNKLSYLLSWDSIAASLHVIRGEPASTENEDADWPWKFPPSMRFEAASAVHDIDPAFINAHMGMTNLNLAQMEKAFADNIFPLLRRAPNVRFHFVLPPYSILVWHDYAQRDQIQTYFAFNKWLAQQAERFRNFDVIDYQDRADIITNLSRYADIYHSDEAIDEEMVRSACFGADVLTSANVDFRDAELLKLVKSTDPRRIVEAAKTAPQTGESNIAAHP